MGDSEKARSPSGRPYRCSGRNLQVSRSAGLMIDVQDVRLDLLAIASATDCPMWCDLAAACACTDRRPATARAAHQHFQSGHRLPSRA